MATRGTTLVVDDTADVADLRRDVLSGVGYRVIVAPTPEVGLTIPAAFVVRLVLIDAPMPADDDADAGDFWAKLDRLAYSYAAHLTTSFALDALMALVARLLHAGQIDTTLAHATATAGKG